MGSPFREEIHLNDGEVWDLKKLKPRNEKAPEEIQRL
jgi:hypothetical protein